MHLSLGRCGKSRLIALRVGSGGPSTRFVVLPAWYAAALTIFRLEAFTSKGAVGHDNVTFEGGFVILVCQVPWSPGKVPSTPAVLRCPSARWIAPFSAGVAPFSPNRTPICEWLRLLPKALRPLPMVCVLFPGIPKGYAAPRPYRGSGALWNAGWG